MSDLALDQDGDLLLEDNSLLMVDGAAAVTQHLSVRLKLFRGEWFLDIEAGVPWYRDILVKSTSFAVVQQILKDTVLDTPGVLELIDFNFIFNSTTREADLNFKCLSDEGFIDFSQIVEIG